MRTLWLCALLLGLSTPTTTAQPTPSPDYAALFETVWQTVHDAFYDPALHGLDWAGLRTTYAPLAAQAPSDDAFATVVNHLLTRLDASHTRLYTADEPAYHQLLSIFAAGPMGPAIRARYGGHDPHYVGIGLFTEVVEEQTFVRGVLEGGPAYAAGLRRGDQLLQADARPFHPIQAFKGRAGHDVMLTVRTTPDSLHTLTVRPDTLFPHALFETAMRESLRLIDQPDGQRIGYLHAWSYAGEHLHAILQEAVAFGLLSEADALVLDLRDGWGGANPTYLNLFNPHVPTLTQTPRSGEAMTFDFQWRKPVALLVDAHTGSGKEVLAYGFRQYDLGPVVGTPTAGAVLSGRPYLLGDRMVLYLAVADVHVDGQRLEGVGVTPDVVVPRPLPFSQGADPQLDAAIETLLQQLR